MSGMKNKWGLSVGVNKSAWGAPESHPLDNEDTSK